MKLSDSELKQIKEKIDDLVNKGASEIYAISVICELNKLNMVDVCNQLGISQPSNSENDKQMRENDYVYYKDDMNTKYEIVNITNDNYILKNTSNDEVIDATKEEITPIVMENNMKKLNEAQYTVSINNLETTDANTLSQMLSLAGQAEGGDIGDEGIVATEIPTVPSAEPAIEPETEFEPTLSAEMDGPGFEAAEIDNYETPLAAEEAPSMEVEEVALNEEIERDDNGLSNQKFKEGDKVEYSFYTDNDVEMGKGTIIKCEYSDDRASDCYTIKDENGQEKEIYGRDIDNLVKDEKKVTEDVLIPTDKEEEMKDSSSDENLDEEGFDDDINETLRIAGVQLDETEAKMEIKPTSEPKANGSEKKDLPVPPVGKANPAKTNDVPEGQEPDYKEVSTEDVTGYDASKGFEPLPNIKVESIINNNKINSIVETAKKMYAKKDASEWLALDKRYVEKLIFEGVNYSRALKLLKNAKMGK